MTSRATTRFRALISQPGCVVAPGVAEVIHYAKRALLDWYAAPARALLEPLWRTERLANVEYAVLQQRESGELMAAGL